MRLYIDNCCFNRPYDSQRLIRNRLETEAKLYIQSCILEDHYDLVWSYIIDFENSENPYSAQKEEISTWRDVAKIHIIESESIIIRAENIQMHQIKSKDALHISCAIEAGCNFFLTTDDKLLNKDELIQQLKIISPIRFIEIVKENT